MWITLVSSDRVSFDLNTLCWTAMTSTGLPGLIAGSSELLANGLVRKTDSGLQFNVTADVLRPLADALQRIHLATTLHSKRKVRALPTVPVVETAASESFWMLCEMLQLVPYLTHACTNCKQPRPNLSTSTELCPFQK